MIDFTNCTKIDRYEISGESRKEWVIYDSKPYLLKFPSLYKKNNDITYFSQCFSEYISCHIYNLCGLKSQNTLLGTYNYNNQELIVVACEDITLNNYYKLIKLSDIICNSNINKDIFHNNIFVKKKADKQESCHNGILDLIISKSSHNIYDICNFINNQIIVNKSDLMNYFCDMFVLDAFVNNIDRDIKNIGLLFDEKNNKYLISPVFDLGRSLYDYVSSETILRIIKGERKILDEKIYNDSFSVLYDKNGKHINFVDFFRTNDDENFRNALYRIKQKIDIHKINNLIENTPFLTKEYILFYKTIIFERYNVLFQCI